METHGRAIERVLQTVRGRLKRKLAGTATPSESVGKKSPLSGVATLNTDDRLFTPDHSRPLERGVRELRRYEDIPASLQAAAVLSAGQVERLLRNAPLQLHEAAIDFCAHFGMAFEEPTDRSVQDPAVVQYSR